MTAIDINGNLIKPGMLVKRLVDSRNNVKVDDIVKVKRIWKDNYLEIEDEGLDFFSKKFLIIRQNIKHHFPDWM